MEHAEREYIKNIKIDLTKIGNLLILGSTGMGKSFIEHKLIKEIRNKDKNAKFILFDPKCGYEFKEYKNLENIEIYEYAEELSVKLKKICENEEYSNLYIFFDEYDDYYCTIKYANKYLEKFIKETKNRNIHLIVCSQVSLKVLGFKKQLLTLFENIIDLNAYK